MIPKKIGVLVNNPEAVYQQRILNGLQRQCSLYGYDLLVFCALIEPQLAQYGADYVMGEFHIFELADTDLLDALIVVSVPMHDNLDYSALMWVTKHLQENCKCPVFTVDLPIGDFPTVIHDDKAAFKEITEHMIVHHGTRKIAVLGGPNGFELTTARLDGIRETMREHGLTLDESDIFEGDFWYTTGNELAEKLLNGTVPMPDCVISLNDYMALGLINTLNEGGIHVPEDLKVIAFDGSQEAMLNDISLTSYIPRSTLLAQETVNRIRALIEPGEPLLPPVDAEKERFNLGESCGCPVNHLERFRSLKRNVLYENRDFARKDILNREDLWGFLQSYMYENLTDALDTADCMDKLCEYLYLLQPFKNFSLCLRTDWEQEQREFVPGYPARIMRVRHNGVDDNGQDLAVKDEEFFDTRLILPELIKEHKPQVIYFAPVHSNKDTAGYAALTMDYQEQPGVTAVYRNWIRAMNHALQISRVKERLRYFSYHDMSTGLYNRRGMEMQLRAMRESIRPGMQVLAFVIDMDGLKYINDNFGHKEGDRAIHHVSKAVQSVTMENEAAIRAGGDEFFIIGVGRYTEEDNWARVEQLEKLVCEPEGEKPEYKMAISVGWCMRMWDEKLKIENVLHDADIAMYREKSAKKYALKR